MKTVGEELEAAIKQLEKAGVSHARLDALVLLEFAAKIDRAKLLAHSEYKVSSSALTKFRQLISRRAQRVPLAYLTGQKEFYGLHFKVSPAVLIPRPETEDIIESVQNLNLGKLKMIDIGTGSGCIAVTLAKLHPSWQMFAADISKQALDIARYNARLHKVKISFHESDLFSNIGLDKFGLVTANLPYVRRGLELSAEGKREPDVALFGGADGLDIYRGFLSELPKYLTNKGYLVVEAEPRQHSLLERTANSKGLRLVNALGYSLVFRQNL